MIVSSKHIYLFQGGNNYEGICLESFNRLKEILVENFQACVFVWNQEKNPPSTWNSRSLCVFPGGICSKWNEILPKHLQEQIMKWISEGGKIFGVCAGAYFCSQESEFLLGDNTTKIREISVFQGICRGPLFVAGIKIIKIKWLKTGQEGHVAMIKGGQLIPYQKEAQEILAVYKESVIAVKSKRGILSTVHFEIEKADVQPLEGLIPELRGKASLLEESREFRLSCLREMYDAMKN